jgi:hypothetical protein
MAHHQEANGVHPQLAGKGDMLGGNIRFRAMGCHTHHPRPGLIGIFQVVQRSDTREQ